MAERKSGPIKPPTLDLRANEAEQDKAGEPAAAKKQSAAARTAAAKSGSGATKQSPQPESKPASSSTGSSAESATSSPRTGKPASTAPAEKPGAGSAGNGGGETTSSSAAPPPEEGDSVVWPFIATGVSGAIAGLALAYGLAIAGYWPQGSGQSGAIAGIRQNMANLQGDVIARVTSIETRLDSLTAASETVDLAALGSEIESIEDRLATLEQAPATGESAGGADLETRLSGLAARLDEIESRPVTETPAPEVANRLSTLSESQSEAQSALSESQAQVENLTTELSALAGRLTDLESQIEAAPDEEDGTARRLPLALSGLETAAATGRSFATELNALASMVPDLSIPANLRSAATAGIARPDEIETSLRRAIPEILAAKPPLVDAGWTERTLDRLASLFAIRPGADPNGTTPGALVARLENAVARRDFVAANRILEALPQPMREAAGTVTDDIAHQAAAANLAATAREAALASPETPQ